MMLLFTQKFNRINRRGLHDDTSFYHGHHHHHRRRHCPCHCHHRLRHGRLPCLHRPCSILDQSPCDSAFYAAIQ